MAYGTVNADVIGTSVAGSNLGAGNASIMKNRIINGAMVIDQRNAGASIATPNGYTLDRFRVNQTTTGKLTAQQNQGSVTPPVGFSNYLGITSSSAYSVATGDAYWIDQPIEGFNFSDLNWGTANAKTVTLSFQVYSSLTGTFGGSLRNSAANRSYPFSYSVPVANTWTTIPITIAGDTSGTWIGATNGVGVYVGWGLGVGSTYNGTSGAWASANYISTTGATSVVGTSGATFYITGVQLEVGSSATGFEYVNYQTSLANCQRYYENNYGVGYAVGSTNAYPYNYGVFFQGFNTTNGQKHVYDWFKVTKRANPTVTYYDYGGNSGKITSLDSGGTGTNNVSIGYTPLNQNNLAVGNTATWYGVGFFWTASAEL